MQALAQSTIQDLHSKLAARTAEVEEGERRVQAARSLAAAEVAGLQDRIEQLTHQLQLQDQRHVKVRLTQRKTLLLGVAHENVNPSFPSLILCMYTQAPVAAARSVTCQV